MPNNFYKKCLIMENKKINKKELTTWIFTREGNKFKYTDKIINCFPDHEVYIEPFVGLGSVFFIKENNTKMNILNDKSLFIYELLETLKNEDTYNNLINEIQNTPIYWDILNNGDTLASKILVIINSFRASCCSFKLDSTNYKTVILKNLQTIKYHVLDYLNKNTKILNKNVFDFLKNFDSSIKNKKTLIYCDPPYSLNKGRLKDNKGWNGLIDLERLIIELNNTNCNYAISEHYNLSIYNLFKKYNLDVKIIDKSKGQNSNKLNENKGKSVEILVINYKTEYNNCMFDFEN